MHRSSTFAPFALFASLALSSLLVACGGGESTADAADAACAAPQGIDAAADAQPPLADAAPDVTPPASTDFCDRCAPGQLCIDEHILGIGPARAPMLADGGDAAAQDDASDATADASDAADAADATADASDAAAYFAPGCFPMPAACAARPSCPCLLAAAGDFCHGRGEAECAWMRNEPRLRCALDLP